MVTLGGDSGLRGYKVNEFLEYGGSVIRGSAEYRSLPLELSSIHFGGVLFYDVGAVYSSIDHAQPEHSVGGGLRVLFPQFNRYPFRVDLGIPLGHQGFCRFATVAPAIALTAPTKAGTGLGSPQ